MRNVHAGTCEIGIISDTHGLLRPEAVDALQGSDLIIHAGDIGDEAVLDRLGKIAPVFAVRGNNDHGGWTDRIPDSRTVSAGGQSFYVLHDVKELKHVPAADKCRAVIAGHSHRPSVKEHEGVLFINPGSAGPRRFRLPITVARLKIEGPDVSVKIIALEPKPAAAS